MTRTFTDEPAVRVAVPLFIGLMGPSGGGKTRSALELAAGIQEISGGEIFGIDTENERMTHFALLPGERPRPGKFQFRRVKLDPPYNALDYLGALKHCIARGATIVIIDSMSHEHDGEGGLIDLHDRELTRMAGTDYQKRERMKMLAWAVPKANRKMLLAYIVRLPIHLICCFRADEQSKPGKDESGKSTLNFQGFVPIAGKPFVYEMSTCMLLPPNARGVPNWRPENPGEKLMVKWADQFDGILNDGKALSREHGRRMAEWARGGAAPQQAVDVTALEEAGRAAAHIGSAALKDWFLALPPAAKRQLEDLKNSLKPTAEEADRRAQSEQQPLPDRQVEQPNDPWKNDPAVLASERDYENL